MSYSEVNENDQPVKEGNEPEFRQTPVVAPQFPQQLQVPFPSGAEIPAYTPGMPHHTGMPHTHMMPHQGAYPNEVYAMQTPHTGVMPYTGMKQPHHGFHAGLPYPSAQPGLPHQLQPAMPGQPMWPGQPTPGVMADQVGQVGMLPLEQSYIENILRFNLGKRATFYQTFEYNPEWPARVFHGIIDEAGRDHIIIRSPETGKSYLLLMVNLDYVEFDEPIAYIPPPLPGFVATMAPREKHDEL
jgi:spore germination protein Q